MDQETYIFRGQECYIQHINSDLALIRSKASNSPLDTSHNFDDSVFRTWMFFDSPEAAKAFLIENGTTEKRVRLHAKMF